LADKQMKLICNIGTKETNKKGKTEFIASMFGI